MSTAQQPNGVSAVLLLLLVEREREKEKSRAPGKKCADRPASLVVVNLDDYCLNSIHNITHKLKNCLVVLYFVILCVSERKTKPQRGTTTSGIFIKFKF